MSLTTQEVLEIYEGEVARGKTAPEALVGARTRIHQRLLDRTPSPGGAHEDDAHHSADAWEETDRLLHIAGIGPEAQPIAGRTIAAIEGHAVAFGRKA